MYIYIYIYIYICMYTYICIYIQIHTYRIVGYRGRGVEYEISRCCMGYVGRSYLRDICSAIQNNKSLNKCECTMDHIGQWMYMTDCTENATPPRSTESRNSNSSIQIQITPKSHSDYIHIYIYIYIYKYKMYIKIGLYLNIWIYMNICTCTYIWTFI